MGLSFAGLLKVIFHYGLLAEIMYLGHFIWRFFGGYRDQNVVICEIVITRVIELKNIFRQTCSSYNVLIYDRKYYRNF